ncbi:MAG TPA: hypothetical protein VF880_08510 [Actinomycetes bacterium]|jgi:hypothetical protein
MGLIAVVDMLFPAVPDTGTVKAARLANQVTGEPGRWVTLDCQHKRHIQDPVEEGQVLECPTCPPSPVGALSHRRLLRPVPERPLRARLAAEPLAPTRARDLAAEAVTAAGLGSLVDEVGLLAGELVASAIRQTEAPVDLTVDAHDDVVRIEVGKVVWCELRDQHARGA